MAERIKELEEELGRLKGTHGTCSVCGEEKKYLNRRRRLCKECSNLERAEQAGIKGREKYGHLLGQKVVALFVSSYDDDLAALELADGHILEVESTREGGAYFDIRNKHSGGRGHGMSHWDYAEVRDDAE